MKKNVGMTPNPDFVPRNETAQPAEPTPVRRSKSGQWIAGVALAGVVAAGTALTINREAEESELRREQTAAVEIAKRFDCKLVSITDLQTPPIDEVARSFDGERTTVEVTVGVNNTSTAKPYLELYKDDPAVSWLPPAVGGRVGDLSIPDSSWAGRSGPSYQDGDTTLTARLYPRVGEAYAPGTTAVIAVHQEVHTSDDKNLYTVEGDMPCGVMEYNGTTWGISMAPAPEAPTVDFHADPWQN